MLKIFREGRRGQTKDRIGNTTYEVPNERGSQTDRQTPSGIFTRDLFLLLPCDYPVLRQQVSRTRVRSLFLRNGPILGDEVQRIQKVVVSG